MQRSCLKYLFFFFFQAEDGIRDLTVTGVQTCALPIYGVSVPGEDAAGVLRGREWGAGGHGNSGARSGRGVLRRELQRSSHVSNAAAAGPGLCVAGDRGVVNE